MNFDSYVNKLDYPQRLRRMCDDCGSSYSIGDKFCSECGAPTNFEQKEEIYKRAIKDYRIEDEKCLEGFRKDALEDVGSSDHSKADKIYSFAWEHGHSSGLHEVYFWLEEISDLFE